MKTYKQTKCDMTIFFKLKVGGTKILKPLSDKLTELDIKKITHDFNADFAILNGIKIFPLTRKTKTKKP